MEMINPQGWLRAPGWSHAVKAEMGDKTLIKIAGQVGWDMTQQVMVSDDLVSQYEQALKNICTIIKEVGAEPSHIIDMHIYVVNVFEFNSRAKEMGQAYRTHMGKHFPALTLLGVNQLFSDNVKVEVEATVVK